MLDAPDDVAPPRGNRALAIGGHPIEVDVEQLPPRVIVVLVDGEALLESDSGRVGLLILRPSRRGHSMGRASPTERATTE